MKKIFCILDYISSSPIGLGGPYNFHFRHIIIRSVNVYTTVSSSQYLFNNLSSRGYHVCYHERAENVDSFLYELPDDISEAVDMVPYQGPYWTIDFEFSEERMKHRNMLYRFIYDGYFLYHFKSYVPFLFALYWHFEHLINNIEDTIDRYGYSAKDKGLLRMVLRFLQNEVLEVLNRIDISSIDVPSLIRDSKRVTYTKLCDCVDNDVTVCMSIVKQSLIREILQERKKQPFTMQITQGDYLLLFSFKAQLLSNVYEVFKVKPKGRYLFQDRKGWLFTVIYTKDDLPSDLGEKIILSKFKAENEHKEDDEES